MDEKQRECFTKAYDKAAELILKATDEFTEKFPPSEQFLSARHQL